MKCFVFVKVFTKTDVLVWKIKRFLHLVSKITFILQILYR